MGQGFGGISIRGVFRDKLARLGLDSAGCGCLLWADTAEGIGIIGGILWLREPERRKDLVESACPPSADPPHPGQYTDCQDDAGVQQAISDFSAGGNLTAQSDMLVGDVSGG